MRSKLWLGVAISAVLLWVAVRGVSLEEVLHQIQSVRPGWLLPVLASIFCRFWLTAVRWQLLLRPVRRIGVHRLFGITMIGFMANNLLPFRAGELVRVFAATKLSGARLTATMSSIAVERIFDGLAVIGLLGAGLLFSDLPSGVAVGGVSLARAAQVAGLISVAALLGAAAVVAFPLAAEGLVRRLLPAGGLADRIVAIIEGIRHGLASLRSPGLLAGVVLWSLVLWLVNAASFWVSFAAFDIPVGFAGALILQGVLVIGISVQLTPGFVGQFEAAIVAALALYGISNEVASSYAIAYHGATFLPITLAGAWSLARTPVALSDLRGTRAP